MSASLQLVKQFVKITTSIDRRSLFHGGVVGREVEFGGVTGHSADLQCLFNAVDDEVDALLQGA